MRWIGIALSLLAVSQLSLSFASAAMPGEVEARQVVRTPVPTAALVPSASPTLPASRTPTATFTLIPTNTPRPTLTASATRTPTEPSSPSETPTATPTSTVVVNRAATLTPPAAGEMVTLADHYYMARPLSEHAVNYAARTYPYGGTAGGRLQTHLGQDFENQTGTPVLAAADGVVVYAGDDLTTLIGPYNNYYGNAVIIQHNFNDSSGVPVYTLYGHLSRVTVASGQTVKRGDPIGHVGAEGIAMGPHLHFEVRVGNPFDFLSTRNPDLWVYPYFGFGTLAGRVTDATGNLLNDVTLTVENGAATRYTFSYADNTVNGDTVFGENWTLGDLPEGYYTVRVSENGRTRFEQEVYVFPAKTTWVDVILSP